MKPKKQRVVKAWAIVLKKKRKIENADYFARAECCNAGETEAMAVYATFGEAETQLIGEQHEIVPITITFTPK